MNENIIGEVIFDPQKRWYNAFLNTLQPLRPPPKVIIKDETLREGEETPGVVLTLEDKLRVASALAEIGIQEVEVGYSGAIREHYEFTKRLKESGIKLRLSSHTRAYTPGEEWKKEIDLVIESGADIVNLLARASTFLTDYLTPWLKKEEVPERVRACVEYAKGQGAFTAFGLSDPARTRLDLVINCILAAVEAGVDRLYVYDGPGCATPETISFLVRLYRALSNDKCEIAVHAHNDFGLATANTIAGALAGAKVLDTTVNGLGDRAGNADFGEVVAVLTVFYNVDTGIKLEKLYELSKLVADIYGIPIHPMKPLVGENVYRHETDSHVQAILRGDWYTFEVIRAEAIGRRRLLLFGPSTLHTGKSSAINVKIEQMGYTATEEDLKAIADRIREIINRKKFATEEEVERIIKEYFAQQR
jgi:isopropylmalate/homocitrate/citramalate synthase